MVCKPGRRRRHNACLRGVCRHVCVPARGDGGAAAAAAAAAAAGIFAAGLASQPDGRAPKEAFDPAVAAGERCFWKTVAFSLPSFILLLFLSNFFLIKRNQLQTNLFLHCNKLNHFWQKHHVHSPKFLLLMPTKKCHFHISIIAQEIMGLPMRKHQLFFDFRHHKNIIYPLQYL